MFNQFNFYCGIGMHHLKDFFAIFSPNAVTKSVIEYLLSYIGSLPIVCSQPHAIFDWAMMIHHQKMYEIINKKSKFLD